MLVFEYSHDSQGRVQRTAMDVIVTRNWHEAGQANIMYNKCDQ